MTTDPLRDFRWKRAPRSHILHLFAEGSVGAECGYHAREIPTGKPSQKQRHCRACQDAARTIASPPPSTPENT